jgi:excisionase family DNA binding protein
MNALANKSNPPTANVETVHKFFMRPDEAATFLDVSKRTLSNLQKRRAISYSKLGRVVVFKVSDLIAAVEKFRVAAVGEAPTKTIISRRRRAGRVSMKGGIA